MVRLICSNHKQVLSITIVKGKSIALRHYQGLEKNDFSRVEYTEGH